MIVSEGLENWKRDERNRVNPQITGWSRYLGRKEREESEN